MAGQEIPDLDKLIFLAKARLIREGKEVTDLAVYKTIPIVRKEQRQDDINKRNNS